LETPPVFIQPLVSPIMERDPIKQADLAKEGEKEPKKKHSLFSQRV
jgi:hypothetical protein